VHTVPNKSGGGERNTTLADARKLNLYPSVTTILKILAKPALELWKQEQVALAVLTTPRKEGEADDAFVKRVLHEEEQQEQEARAAADLGTQIHDAIEGYFSGMEVPKEMDLYIRGVLDRLLEYGEKASPEVILVGDDYAGMTDLVQDCGEWWRLWDFKSSKNLPDPAKGGAWLEHRLQLAAYAKAFKNRLTKAGQGLKPILVGNIYISTITPGQYVICEHEDWETAFDEGFAPLVRHWQWINRYRPENPNRITLAKAQADVSTHYQIENGKLRQELEALRAQLAVAQQNTLPPAAATLAAAEAAAEEAAKDPNEPAVIPEQVAALKKAGKRVAWSGGVAVPQPAPQGVPLPGTGAPGQPSPMVQRAPALPPRVVPGRLVNGPDGKPVWQPGEAK
jgi:hypothetical protein